jgi:hypothetical protein
MVGLRRLLIASGSTSVSPHACAQGKQMHAPACEGLEHLKIAHSKRLQLTSCIAQLCHARGLLGKVKAMVPKCAAVMRNKSHFAE